MKQSRRPWKTTLFITGLLVAAGTSLAQIASSVDGGKLKADAADKALHGNAQAAMAQRGGGAADCIRNPMGFYSQSPHWTPDFSIKPLDPREFQR